MSSKRQTRGVGNLVIAIYAVFALSASVRALYQLFRKYDEAPLAYWLSLVAAVVYVVATLALAKGKFELARATLIFELIGVLIVGSLSYAVPDLFAHPSVWSYFGLGYGLIPLLLPVFGLWWIGRAKR
jgi:intracellular septation protein A